MNTSVPVVTIGVMMNKHPFLKDLNYLKFEKKLMTGIEDLWYDTKDEALRLNILRLREILERIYWEKINESEKNQITMAELANDRRVGSS